MGIDRQVFGITQDSGQIDLYTLTNSHGMTASIINYGGIVVTLKTPDRNGNIANVVLGFESLGDYQDDNQYLGCIAGRCANRISGGKFSIEGKTYYLKKNTGRNHLHGGDSGFNKRVWTALPEDNREGASRLALQYLSPDMEEGYPGNLKVTVIYSLTNANAFKIEYIAETDSPTIVNLTQHSYFNLTGSRLKDCLDHEIMINADHFLPIDTEIIPTGEIRSVKGTPLDFLKPAIIGGRIHDSYDQLQMAGGYDHTWVLNNSGNLDKPAARAYDPAGGRVMEVYTNQPGIQFYSGNQLGNPEKQKSGFQYKRYSGFCLETQKFPDAPNHADFPSIVLLKEEIYSYTTIYRFSVA